MDLSSKIWLEIQVKRVQQATTPRLFPADQTGRARPPAKVATAIPVIGGRGSWGRFDLSPGRPGVSGLRPACTSHWHQSTTTCTGKRHALDGFFVREDIPLLPRTLGDFLNKYLLSISIFFYLSSPVIYFINRKRLEKKIKIKIKNQKRRSSEARFISLKLSDLFLFPWLYIAEPRYDSIH